MDFGDSKIMEKFDRQNNGRSGDIDIAPVEYAKCDSCGCNSSCCSCCPCRNKGSAHGEQTTPRSRARKKKLLFPDESGTYAFPNLPEDEFDTPNKRVAKYVLAPEHADSDVSWIFRKLDRHNNDSTDTSEVTLPIIGLSESPTSRIIGEKAVAEDEYDTPNKRAVNYVLAPEHTDSDVTLPGSSSSTIGNSSSSAKFSTPATLTPAKISPVEKSASSSQT